MFVSFSAKQILSTEGNVKRPLSDHTPEHRRCPNVFTGDTHFYSEHFSQRGESLHFFLQIIFTVRNEIAKVMILQASVCPQGGSTWPGTPPWDQVHPPGIRYTPWEQTPPGPGTPPGPNTTPGTRYTPPDQVHPQTRYSPPEQTPPGPGTPPRSRPSRPGKLPQDHLHPPKQTPPPQHQVHPKEQTPPLGPGTPPGTRYIPAPGPGTPPQDQVPLPRDMATAAYGTHPTGMHSCHFKKFQRYKNYVESY